MILTKFFRNKLVLAVSLALAGLWLGGCDKRSSSPPLSDASSPAGGTAEAASEWLTDFAAAQARAKAEKKMVLMDFTGSDWCPPCKALHKNVLTQQEFADYAKDNLVLVLVDFPENKPQSEEQERTNKELAEKFGVESFPTVIVLDSEGGQLSKTSGYDGSGAKDFVAGLKKLQK